MITVKLYGLLRIESGIKELQLDAVNMKQVYTALQSHSDTLNQKELERCVILINGKKGTKNSKLQPGDIITLMSPVAGG